MMRFGKFRTFFSKNRNFQKFLLKNAYFGLFWLFRIFQNFLNALYRDHKEKGTCDDRIDKGLHVKPKCKEDEMGIKEKLALALKRRRKIRKAVRNPDAESKW